MVVSVQQEADASETGTSEEYIVARNEGEAVEKAKAKYAMQSIPLRHTQCQSMLLCMCCTLCAVLHLSASN